MKKAVWFSISIILGWQIQVMAQNKEDIEVLLKAGTEDLNTYMKSYIEPAAKGYAYSMGTGWIQTAETHSTLGFHIKASISAVTVPSSYNTFNFDPDDYNHIRTKEGSGSTALPTIFGPSNNNPVLEIYDRKIIAETAAPPGAGLNYIPVPSIQAGLGLPAGTEVMLRVIPKTKINKTQISQIGYGLKHDIKQHIPGLKALPFSLSGLVAYNSMEISYYMDPGAQHYGKLQVIGWTFKALASKELGILTVYGSGGYNMGKSDFKLVGTYELEGPQQSEHITIPILLSYEAIGPTASIGARIKLGPLFINGDYTFQEFNTLTVGFGASIN